MVAVAEPFFIPGEAVAMPGIILWMICFDLEFIIEQVTKVEPTT